MDAWTKALQPVSAPDFIDNAFKDSPGGVSFRQWQPVDGMLDSMGRQLEGEDVLNHGGSSQGSQTAMDSPHRRIFSGGQGDTNNGSNSTGSTNDMQDVNSPLQDPGRISGASAARGNRQRTDTVRALNKLAQQRYRERQRQKFDNLQNKKGEYADTVEKLQQVMLDNRRLEEEKRKLEDAWNELQYIKPSSPAMSNGYSDNDSNNSSSSLTTFSNRVGRTIPVEPEEARAYKKTEQAWFAKVDDLRACMESLGFWGQGPTGVAADELSNEALMKLGGALQGVVELCCKVAQMEGVEMNTLLKRTYETCSNIHSWKDPDRWITAAQDGQLSAEQKRDFIHLRRLCLEKLKEVYADRQRLSAMVVDNLLPTNGGENVDPTTAPKSLNAITVQLEENLKEEQRFNCQMLYTVFKHCLNPVQAGWLILKSFPEHVDVLAFMNAIENIYGHNGKT